MIILVQPAERNRHRPLQTSNQPFVLPLLLAFLRPSATPSDWRSLHLGLLFSLGGSPQQPSQSSAFTAAPAYTLRRGTHCIHTLRHSTILTVRSCRSPVVKLIRSPSSQLRMHRQHLPPLPRPSATMLRLPINAIRTHRQHLPRHPHPSSPMLPLSTVALRTISSRRAPFGMLLYKQHHLTIVPGLPWQLTIHPKLMLCWAIDPMCHPSLL